MPSSVLYDKIPHTMLFLDDPVYFVSPCVFVCTRFVYDLTLGKDKLTAKILKYLLVILAYKNDTSVTHLI